MKARSMEVETKESKGTYHPMNVKELKEAIANLPDDMQIMIDSEHYRPLDDADSDNIYVPETTWFGTAYSTEWSANDANMDEEEWEELKLQPRVLVLTPVR